MPEPAPTIPATQRRVVLAARPEGIPQAEHFRLEDAPVVPPGPGQVLVRIEVVSVDPAMRGWVSAVANYSDPVPIDGVMRAFAVGVIVESRAAGFKPGTRVMGMFGWQQWATVDASVVDQVIANDDLPPSLYLGTLGLTGATAWFALTDIGRPCPGETVVVSTAAGSVGSVAGQLAKLAGCRTVGITGGAEKVRLCLEEFGFDAAVDYRSPTFTDDLAAALPNGVDIYYDNTSGVISDAVHRHLNRRGRIIVCGTASVASWNPVPMGPRVERLLLTKSARIEGFLYFDYEHRLGEAIARLAPLVRSGAIRYREEFLDGLEAAPDSVAGLYRGENLGKRLIRV